MIDTPASRPDVLRERPFYFMMNFWGDEFRWMFVNLCLASLLSPGNIPALVNKRDSRFLILAPRADLDAIEREPLVADLREHIQTECIEIPDPEPGRHQYNLNVYSYKIAADLAFANKAYGLFLCPDTLVSDGTILRLQERARRGAKAVLVAALRHDQEAMLRWLRNSSEIELGKPLCLGPRQLMKIGLSYLHPQVLLHDWDGTTFSTHPGFALWRVPGSDGLILHTMRWNPLLISYAELSRHVTWSRFGGADHIAMDDDYIFNNFGDDAAIHAVTDTDEIAYVSLTPAGTAHASQTTASEFSKRICLRVNAGSSMMDPLQQRLFREHIRMHSDDVTQAWTERERKIDAVLDATFAHPATAVDRLWRRYGARGLRRLGADALARITGRARPVLKPVGQQIQVH